jgi:pimeloyl-ACP methyl ester carboxylesterase
LLRRLGIQRVAVVGSSGGGPYALDFARRYPRMCSALVLISAVSMTFERDPSPSVIAQVFGIPLGRDFGIWAVRDTFPRSIKHIDLADPVTRAYVDAMMESAIPTHRRQAGFENDWDNFQDLAWLHIEEIRAPTLVLHGTEDDNVPYEHARHSASRIDGAKLVTFEGYDHFIHITQRTAIAAEIDELLAENQSL